MPGRYRVNAETVRLVFGLRSADISLGDVKRVYVAGGGPIFRRSGPPLRGDRACIGPAPDGCGCAGRCAGIREMPVVAPCACPAA